MSFERQIIRYREFLSNVCFSAQSCLDCWCTGDNCSQSSDVCFCSLGTCFNFCSIFLDCRKSMMQIKYISGKWAVLSADIRGIDALGPPMYAWYTSVNGVYGHRKYWNTCEGAVLTRSVKTDWNFANSQGCKQVWSLRQVSPAMAANTPQKMTESSMGHGLGQDKWQEPVWWVSLSAASMPN